MLNTSLSTFGWPAVGEERGNYSVNDNSLAPSFALKDKVIIDSLGTSAWDETYHQTFSYRWKGQDTLTWGNVDEWIRVHWVMNLLLRDKSASLEQEIPFQNIIREVRIAKLFAQYSVFDPIKVKRFLSERPSLISVLFEARVVIDNFFNFPEISLRVISDPEAAQYNQLFAYIITSYSPDIAFEKLSKFDNAWLLKQDSIMGDALTFNLQTHNEL